MSLDIYLELDDLVCPEEHAAIFIRENGSTREISRSEWDKRFPNSLPCTATVQKNKQVFSANVTHNMVPMAEEAGLYCFLWRPEDNGIKTAEQLVELLEEGIKKMKSDPRRFKKLNPSNGWGDYDMFVKWLENLLVACKANPTASVRVWR